MFKVGTSLYGSHEQMIAGMQALGHEVKAGQEQFSHLRTARCENCHRSAQRNSATEEIFGTGVTMGQCPKVTQKAGV